MSRMVDVSADGMLAAWLRHSASTALAGAALIGFGASGWFGYGYLHYWQIAVEQEAAMRRVENANVDLQSALDRLHDDIQRRFQQLNADNDLLRARVGELEQELSQSGRVLRPSRKPAAAQGTRGPVATTSGQDRSLGAAVFATPTGSKNFTAPGWVPNYFSGENATFIGSSSQRSVHATTADHNHHQRLHSRAARSRRRSATASHYHRG